MCGVILKNAHPHRRGPLAWFNKYLDFSRNTYTNIVAWLIRKAAIGVVLFLIIAGGAWYLSERIPTSFLPQEDKGGFLIDVQLPEGATLERTVEVTTEATRRLLEMEGVERVLAVDGFSLLSGRAENVGFVIADLEPWDERTRPDLHIDALVQKVSQELNSISTASIRVFVPPPIQGLGVTGGFDFRLQALEDQPPQELAAAAMGLVGAATQHPALSMVYTTYSADTPQLWLDLKRTRMEELGVSAANLFSTLNQHLGSQYVNDFNLYGRTYQVKVRAQDNFRKNQEDIKDLYVSSIAGKEIPVENLLDISTILGAKSINRYNQFTSLTINGQAAPGYSSGQAMETMKELAAEHLPPGYSFEWSTMSLQEQTASGTVGYLFALALIFAYLFLVAQYESWNLPLSIILSVIVATCGALIGLLITGLPMSIYAQIGMVLLVGLAAKNAILIVEFARDRKEEGIRTRDAAVEGAKLRFRAVLMTALTFILGVAPLVWAMGAGAASRRHIGVVVFSGMIAASTVALFIIPVLYYLLQSLRDKSSAWKQRRRERLANQSAK
jgi:HAE1 family hydrophobic/amphiphilic exporter-1